MPRLTIRLTGPAAWAGLLAVAVLAALLVYDSFRPSREELFRTRCDGYSGTVVAHGSDTTFVKMWRSHVDYIVVRDDSGREASHMVTGTDLGMLPMGVRVERKPGCSEVPMTKVREYLRAHPEILERIRP